MATKLWQFSAVDTLFFRGSAPFNAGEGGQTDVAGLFPPYMTTLQGAIRTTLAYQQGWYPGRKWPEELGGANDLGQLSLQGPYLLRDGLPLFPAPALLLEAEQCADYVRLVPGTTVTCDLDDVRLPVPMVSMPGLKPLTEKWLTFAGMEAVLAGNVPEKNQVISEAELWCNERRIGIELNSATGTATDGQLYSSVHVRPAMDVTLGVLVTGVPANWGNVQGGMVALGGEGRMAGLTVEQRFLNMPKPPTIKSIDGIVNYTITLITPGFFQDAEKTVRHGPQGVPGQCVSACLFKAEQVGGWDLHKGEPRPLQPLLPAGCTWFFQADEKSLPEIYNLHGSCLGDKREYGFGQILIGYWRE